MICVPPSSATVRSSSDCSQPDADQVAPTGPDRPGGPGTAAGRTESHCDDLRRGIHARRDAGGHPHSLSRRGPAGRRGDAAVAACVPPAGAHVGPAAPLVWGPLPDGRPGPEGVRRLRRAARPGGVLGGVLRRRHGRADRRARPRAGDGRRPGPGRPGGPVAVPLARRSSSTGSAWRAISISSSTGRSTAWLGCTHHAAPRR